MRYFVVVACRSVPLHLQSFLSASVTSNYCINDDDFGDHNGNCMT